MNSIPFFGDRSNCLQLLNADTHIVAINLLLCLLNLQIKQTPSSLRIFIREYVNFYNLFNNDVIMSSLVTKPNSSTSQ